MFLNSDLQELAVVGVGAGDDQLLGGDGDAAFGAEGALEGVIRQLHEVVIYRPSVTNSAVPFT